MSRNDDRSFVSPILIGRATELAALNRLIEQARAGRGQIVLISGEAGIGKSRLVSEIKRATQGKFLFLQGNCYETDLDLPYAPWLDLLRAFIATRSREQLASDFSSASELVKILPELGVLPTLIPIPPLGPEQEKRRLLHSLAQFFKNVAPAHIVIEDLHWCDDASLEFLLFLTRQIAPQGNLLFLTYRSDETNGGLNHLLAALDREHIATELTLPQLLPVQVSEMMSAISNSKQVHHDFVEAIYALTEGNPFFVEETLKSLVTRGDIVFEKENWDRKPLNELHIPRSVHDAVQRRVDRLSPAARNALTVAAVIGRRFDLSLLQHLTGLDERELLNLIKEMVAAQLVVEEGADQFLFRHALTRESVYAFLLQSERKRHHCVIGETLEKIYQSTLHARVTDLAYHYFQAEQWDKALEYSQRAGEQAQALYAPRAAVENYNRAIQAAQHLGIAVPMNLYRMRGQAYETIGEFEKARIDYAITLETARADGNKRSEWQALCDLGSLWASRDYHQTGDYFQRALMLAQTMNDAPTLGRSLNRSGNWHLNVERPREGLDYHRQALAIFQSLNDRRGTAETLDLLGLSSFNSGDLIGGAGYYQQAVALFRELDDRTGLASALGTLPMCAGDYHTNTMVAAASLAQVATEPEDAIRISSEMGFRSGEAYALSSLALCLGSQGEYGRALQAAQRAIEIAEEIEHREWLTRSRMALGAIYLDLFALEPARQFLEQAHQLAREIGSLLFIRLAAGFLAEVEIAARNFVRAESLLDAAVGPQSATETLGERHCWYARAELALARGDTQTALHIAEKLIATARNTHGRVIPRLWAFRGQVLIASKHLGEAEKSLQAAREAAMTQTARPLVWRIGALLGRLLVRKRGEEADEEIANARKVVAELAATVMNADLREKFMQCANEIIGASHALSPRRVAKIEFGGLTERERQVASLVAQGQSNRSIAETLVVSEYTVATHVQNILNKLAFNSRTQIAAWAIGKGLGKAN